MMNIAVIPARGGSKRLPGKNILPLNGTPLIAHSIIQAIGSGLFESVYVSTDDDQIAAAAVQFGAEVVKRPIELAGDTEPTVSALRHVLETINNTAENVFLLQPTNPLRPENLLAEAYELFLQSGADSLMTVSKNHHKLGKIQQNRFIPFNYEMGQRSQDIEPLYFENGLLYITRSQFIMQDIILAENNYAMIIDHPFAAVDIDTQTDLDYASYLHKNTTLKI